jgi:hypothetical protein
MIERRQAPQPKLDLNELLYHAPGSEPAWADVVEFWNLGEFPEEHYLVSAIEKYLLTSGQQQRLVALGLSLEDVLNGRYRESAQMTVNVMLSDWNTRLGFSPFYVKSLGVQPDPPRPPAKPEEVSPLERMATSLAEIQSDLNGYHELLRGERDAALHKITVVRKEVLLTGCSCETKTTCLACRILGILHKGE